MTITELAEQTIATYERHGWRLRGALLMDQHREEFEGTLLNVPIESAPIDALWFSRSSHGNREAWELRLLAETPYALFETIADDADEASKALVKAEMVKRMNEREGSE